MSDLTDTLADAFGEDTDADTASTAAENVTAFADQYAEDLTAQTVLDTFETAPYADFGHAFDWTIGSLAADNDDCTDSREFRLAGFDHLAADPEMSA